MSWLGRLTPPPLVGASGGTPAGPAMTALRSVAARMAAIIRCVGMAYVVVQVIIWHPFYEADPWRLAGPAAAAAWGAAIVAYLRRHWPSWPLTAIDAGVYLALALCAGWCVPPAIRGEAASWLFIAMASQLVVPAWFAQAVVSAPLALAAGTAFWAGTLLAQAAGFRGSTHVAAAGALLLVAASIHWTGRQILYRNATSADVALAAADRDARDQYVVLSRNMERREHERMLHDTVLNTLTALTRVGVTDTAEVVGRCRRDVMLMEYALSDPGGPATAADRPAGGLLAGGLLAGLEAVATEMRARGLAVHFAVTSGVPARTEDPGENALEAGAEGGLVVPVAVAGAITHAAREALANVASHAGTREAWVEVSLTAAGGEGAAPGGLLVTVRDSGGGFDPDRVDPARLGLRRSIVERIADWGGRASVHSAPGEGTVVSLRWPAPAPASQVAGAGRGPDQRDLPW